MSDNQLSLDANVYLQGRGALEPTGGGSLERMTYYVASPTSHIRVQDFRPNPNRVARQVLQGDDSETFADAFSQPAQVEIHHRADGIDIDLHEPKSNGDGRTLWLGVLEGDRWPVHSTEWEVLKPVSETEIAFAALVV